MPRSVVFWLTVWIPPVQTDDWSVSPMSVIIVVDIKYNYYQDVSDRVEKEPEGSFVVRRLEDGCDTVVKGDWKDHISIELYNGKTIILLYR